MDYKDIKENEIRVERVNDMCGGYVVATQGDISAVCFHGESPMDALERVKNERAGN